MSGKDIDLIYNALDRGDFQKAQQLCDRPEVNKFPLVQGLLAYTYASQRKYDKALELGRKLLKLEPSDEGTVNALGCAFKLCRSDADFATSYETFIRKNTTIPPHFHSELFHAYLRLQDVKKMHSTSQRAYRLTDNPRYVAWMATCILLQPDLPPAMIAVAEKMMVKVFDEMRQAGPPGAGEIVLLVNILGKQGKLREKIPYLQQLIDRPLGANHLLQDEDHFREQSHAVVLSKEQRLFLLLDLLIFAGQWEEVISLGKQLLTLLPDQWNVYELYQVLAFSTNLKEVRDKSRDISFSGLANEKFSSSSSASEDSSSELTYRFTPRDYVLYLRGMKVAYPTLRGPWLAYLYFLTEVVLLKKEEDFLWLLDSSEEANLTFDLILTTATTGGGKLWRLWTVSLLEYVSKFREKFCLFVDLKPLLARLSLLSLDVVSTSLRAIIDWTNAQLEALIGSESFEGIFPPLTEENKPLEVQDVTVTVATTTLTDNNDRADKEEKEEEGEEEPTNPSQSTNKTSNSNNPNKKSNKKKANKKKHSNKSKAGTSTSTNTTTQPQPGKEIEEEKKRLDIDFDHVNVAGTKDNKAVAVVCHYCQLDLIRSYCLHLLETSSSETDKLAQSTTSFLDLTSEAHLTRLRLYSLLCQRFSQGVNSEQRTIQPADELVLIVSSAYRERLRGYLTARSYDDLSIRLANDWLTTLLLAIQASPYNPKLKIDLLEVSRYMNNLAAASHAFHNLGIKHIQYDSLSYLIVSGFIDGGSFSEALTLHKNLIYYHRQCQRECNDVMAKGFEYSNYNSVLEISDFAKEALQSLSLHLAKAEMPLLEIAAETSSPSLEKVKKYVSDLLEDKKYAEYLPYLEEETGALDSLISHLDDSMIESFASTASREEKEGDRFRRKQQLIDRIKVSQDLLYGFYAAYQKDASSLQKHISRLTRIITHWEEQQSSFREESHFIPFDQNVDGFSAFSQSNWRFIVLWLESMLQFAQSDYTSLTVKQQDLSTRLKQFESYLLNWSNITLPVTGFHLSPTYMRDLSVFMRVSYTWMPLFLELLASMTSSSDSFTSEVISNISELRDAWKGLLGKLKEVFMDVQEKVVQQQTIESGIFEEYKRNVLLGTVPLPDKKWSTAKIVDEQSYPSHLSNSTSFLATIDGYLKLLNQ